MKRAWPSLIVLICFVIVLYLAARLLGSATTFLLGAFALSYLTYPSVKWFEKKGIPRVIAVGGIFVMVLGGIGVALFYITPVLFRELQGLINDLPQMAKSALDKISEILKRLDLPFEMSHDTISNYISTHTDEIFKNISSPLFSSASTILAGTFVGVMWILNLVLFPVFFFFLIQDYGKILYFIENLIPPSSRKVFLNYTHKLNNILSGYIRGQLIVCVVLGFLYGLGLAIAQIRYGFLIGCIAGILSLIPYVGFTFGLVSSILVTLATGGEVSQYVGIAIVFSVAQVIENYILVPRLVGNRVGLGSLATILVLIAGAHLGGFIGMMVAIPAGGMLKVVFQDLIKVYKNSALYQT
ncbi:MAG: AI-2E family transporter [Deltaproteobacteria bacterium]|nr:AI-2E family transporter [Deltaproteobacteria bacterium]